MRLANWFCGLLVQIVFANILLAVPKAQEIPNFPLPTALRPWTGYLQKRLPDLPFEFALAKMRAADSYCPKAEDNSPLCSWPGSLKMQISSVKGGTFEQRIFLDSQNYVTLPWTKEAWPKNIKVYTVDQYGKISPYENFQIQLALNSPQLILSAGEYLITGSLNWDNSPLDIRIDPFIALTELELDGQSVSGNSLNLGILKLKVTSNAPELPPSEDIIAPKVIRNFQASIPLHLYTHLKLQVPASKKEYVFPNAGLMGTKLLNVHGALSYYFDDQKNLHLRLNEGVQSIELHSLFSELPAELQIPKVTADFSWPLSETWVLDSNGSKLNLEIFKAVPINPAKSAVPKEWFDLPTYALTPESSMKLSEYQATKQKKFVPLTKLERELWLDFEGENFSIRDRLYSESAQRSRLNMLAREELQRVVLQDSQQAITADPKTSLRGVEIRQDVFRLYSQSILPYTKEAISVSNWDIALDQTKLKLNVPPGWEIIGAKGADYSRGTILSTWTFFTLLLLALFSAVAFYAQGIKAAIFAASLFILVQGESAMIREAMLLGFLLICAYKKFPHKVLRYTTAFALVALLTYVTNYSYHLLLSTINPLHAEVIAKVEPPKQQISPSYPTYSGGGGLETNYNDLRVSGSVNAILTYSEGSFGALVMCLFGAGALLAATLRQFKVGAVLFVLAFSCFLLRSFMATFFNDVSVGEDGYSDSTYVAREDQPASKLPSLVVQSADELLQNSIAYTSPAVGTPLPSWTWRQAEFTWPDPLPQSHNIKFYLLNPAQTFVLNLIKLFLVLLLTIRMAKFCLADLRKYFLFPKTSSALALAFLIFPLLFSSSLYAQTELKDDKELLEQIKLELLKPVCEKNCILTRDFSIQTRDESLLLTATIESNGPQSWSLYFDPLNFTPIEVDLDGRSHSALRLTTRTSTRSQLQVRIPHGKHSLFLKGKLNKYSDIYLDVAGGVWGLKTDTPGWERAAVDNTSTAIYFRPKLGHFEMRANQSKSQESLENWYVIQRTLTLDEYWKLITKIQRLGPTNTSTQLVLPLLAGEQLITEGLKKINENNLLIRFAEGSSSLELESFISPRQQLEIKPPKELAYTEQWSFSCSERWTCDAFGQNVRSVTDKDMHKIFEWNSQANSKVVISAQSLSVIQGERQNISSLKITYNPKPRFLYLELLLVAEASVAGTEILNITSDAQLMDFKIDRTTTLDKIYNRGQEYEFELKAGTHRYYFEYRIPWNDDFFTALKANLPKPNFKRKIFNLEYEYKVPEDRILAVAHQPVSKALSFSTHYLVKIFMLLIILGFAAYFLSLDIILAVAWVCAGLLLCQNAPIYCFLWSALLLYVYMRFASQLPKQYENKVYLSAIALGCVTAILLFYSIMQTLMLGPDLGIAGNNSDSHLLRWFFDSSSGELPTLKVACISLASARGALVTWLLGCVYIAKKVKGSLALATLPR